MTNFMTDATQSSPLHGLLPSLSRKRVALAPMSGVTDLPFRKFAAQQGAAWVVSEMVASEELVKARPDVVKRAEGGGVLAPFIIQLAGRDPYWLAEGAKIAEQAGADIIDINMGCPAKKVTGKLSGSALMRDPRLAAAIMQAVKSAVQVPVTLKMRLGWDDHNLNAAEFGRIAEDAGLSMLAVHGRTRCQMYNGDADWHKIAAVVDAVSIPVIANGDIRCVDTAKQAIAASGAAGVMVGRGAQGRPWVLAQIGDVLAGRQMRATPSIRARHACMRAHLDDMITHYGAAAMRLARKHIAWYAYGLPGAAELRDIANNTTDAATVFAAVDQFFHKLYDQAEAA